MAFSTVPTVATSDSWTASQHNTYIKDNFSAIWVGTTAGDLDYYTGATSKSRLALTVGGLLYGGASAPAWLAGGTEYKVLQMGATYPEWAPLIYRRQGGSATSWSSAGTTTYTPTNPRIIAGVKSATISTSGEISVTFPITFTYNPNVICTVNAATGGWTCQTTGISTTGFTAKLRDVTTSGSISVDLHWEAKGE